MSAIRRGKIYARKRVELGEVVPLAVPFSVQLDVCSACNLSCNFCVHSDQNAIKKSGVQWGMMPFELFTHIIDDMKAHWGGRLRNCDCLKSESLCCIRRYARWCAMQKRRAWLN